MSPFLLSAIVLTAALVAPLAVIYHGGLVDGVVALVFVGAVVTAILLELSAADHDSALADPALVLAFLAFGSGIVYVHFFERRM